ncbi:MAG: hypothetical protein EBQ85_09555 [Proteobacteria bacterium]|nr:hypothetical protein [Pseudomonadota bacterium]
MKNPYKSFHSSCEDLRKHIHIVLVHPEYGGNVGAAARAIENMGLLGSFRIVGNKEKLEWSEVRKMAKHAFHRVAEAEFFSSLEDALKLNEGEIGLFLGSSARVGSSSRPHPLKVRGAMEKVIRKMKLAKFTDLFLIFGRESDGLTNEELDLCHWLVTIPSSEKYRSVNLAQSVMIFAHEVNENLQEEWEQFQAGHPSQKEKIVSHLIQLSEESGFILPGDPFKMKPRLEQIFSQLPPHVPEARTLHGLIDQVRRSIKKGEPDIKGRFKEYGIKN